jgi:hypothetical protein
MNYTHERANDNKVIKFTALPLSPERGPRREGAEQDALPVLFLWPWERNLRGVGMNLQSLTREQLDTLWRKAHRRKYAWGCRYSHADRVDRIQYRILNEESRRRNHAN